MGIQFPDVRVGAALRLESACVFPLFSDQVSHAHYRLAPDALADESLVVEEVSEGGSVPELFVENKGDSRVLFLEGEELVGAKQNRVLNTSLFVPARSRMKVPVSCVEEGRWGYLSNTFSSSGSHVHSQLRAKLRRSVSDSVRQSGRHTSDQAGVWTEVGMLSAKYAVDSPTSSLADAHRAYAREKEEVRSKMPYVKGASGLALAVRGRLVAIDLFDRPETCERVWDRMLSSLFFELRGASAEEVTLDPEVVSESVNRLAAGPWESTPPAGEGEEFRSEVAGEQGCLLTLDEDLVHGSLVC